VPKFGRSAVERNRLKRRIREIIRTHVLQNLPVADVVIRTRPSTYDVPRPELLKELDDSMHAIQQLSL
jgi:ribonuclease P protein component